MMLIRTAPLEGRAPGRGISERWRRLSRSAVVSIALLAAHTAVLSGQTSVVRTVPFELARHILLHARVDTTPAILLFDPVQGAMLDAHFARRAGIRQYSGPELGMGEVRVGGAGDAEFRVSFAKDQTLSIGEMRFILPLSPIIPLDSTLAASIGRRVDGLFGTSLFDDYVVEIDFDSSRFVLHDPRRFRRPRGADSIPLTMYGQRGVVPVALRLTPTDSIRGSFVLDFGMSGAFRLTTHFVDSLELVRRTNATETGVRETGLGGALTSLTATLDALRIGGATFDHPIVTLAREKTGGDAHPPYDGLMGLAAMRRLWIAYDGGRGVVYLRAR